MLHVSTNVSSPPTLPQIIAPESSTISDWSALRRAIDVKESLLRRRPFKWLATLPAHVGPMATARQYARIVNSIGDSLPAILWSAVTIAEPKIPRKVFAPYVHKAEIDLLPV